MAYEHKEGQGSLFKNDKKTGNQPDYRGTGLFNGEKIKFSAWVKEGKNGKFFSLSIQKDADFGDHRNEPLPDSQRPEGVGTSDDFGDVPF